jgi:hypothetical protein
MASDKARNVKAAGRRGSLGMKIKTSRRQSCTGRSNLETVNVYLPPAYGQGGRELAAGQA